MSNRCGHFGRADLVIKEPVVYHVKFLRCPVCRVSVEEMSFIGHLVGVHGYSLRDAAAACGAAGGRLAQGSAP